MSGCTRCGAQLSRYRAEDEPDGICAACASKAPQEAPVHLLAGDELMLAIAGVLALGRALRPDERIHVQAELESLGVLADHVDVHKQVEKLRRRYGWSVDAIEGRAGYRLFRWPFRFSRRPRRGQLRFF